MIMEYGSTIWQCSKSTALLDRVQRKALCFGFPNTSSLEAMEVAVVILPLKFRFAGTAVRDIAKIKSKSMDKLIKQTPSNCLQTTYWSRLDSSKSRTHEQAELGKGMAMDRMIEAPEDTTFTFTDGSCQPNPGPFGAGAVLYPPHLDQLPLKKPVSKRGSILLGELVAVQMALEYFLQHLDTISCKHLKIFSDSQSTVGILTLNWKESSYKDITIEIQQTIATSR